MAFLYNDYSSYLKRLYPFKVQKISLDAGFTCPNRDGRCGYGGCTYCNNQTFSPSYCHRNKSITTQLEEGRNFFSKKYPEMKYLAYFQAYTNTYATLDELKRKYEEALAYPDVVGVVIGTRPDCMPDALLDYLEQLHRQVSVAVEYGIESTSDITLKRINRGHSYADTVKAVCRTAERGIPVGGHVILGLPGETRAQIVEQAMTLSALMTTGGTRMAEEFACCPEDFHLFDVDSYMEVVVDYIEHLRPDLVLERFVSQSPDGLLVAPRWGLKNHEFVHLLQKRMQELGAYQGRKF